MDAVVQQSITNDRPVPGRDYSLLSAKFFEPNEALGRLGRETLAADTNPGDTILEFGKLFVHCGWITAVGHIAGEAKDGERRTISRHSTVQLVREGSEAEREEVFVDRKITR